MDEVGPQLGVDLAKKSTGLEHLKGEVAAQPLLVEAPAEEALCLFGLPLPLASLGLVSPVVEPIQII